MQKPIIICADIIAYYGGQLVLIERLGAKSGIALPGGKQERAENLSSAAIREFREETGLVLKIENVLGTYAEKNRDPRGRFISTVFIGTASGIPKDESGKTHVIMMDQQEILARQEMFLFDHFKILMDYFARNQNP